MPDGNRVESTASGYDPQLDQAAHITYASGNTAAALAPGSIAMDRGFAEDHKVRIGSVLPAEFAGDRRPG